MAWKYWLTKSIKLKKKFQYVSGVEVELRCKYQDDHRSECDCNKKYLLKERKKEMWKEGKRCKQNLVVLKSIWHTSSKKKNHSFIHY